MPVQPIYLKIGPNCPNWQCCLAVTSKMAPRILIFSIAMGADLSFYVKSIATFALTFFGYIISVLASVAKTWVYQLYSCCFLFRNSQQIFQYLIIKVGDVFYDRPFGVFMSHPKREQEKRRSIVLCTAHACQHDLTFGAQPIEYTFLSKKLISQFLVLKLVT